MGHRILIVEDQEDNRRILRDLLTSVGFEILEAETGEDGVARAESEHPDLILMDIQLPGLNGYDATRRIKAQPELSSIPIIAVTSYALLLVMQGFDAIAMRDVSRASGDSRVSI